MIFAIIRTLIKKFLFVYKVHRYKFTKDILGDFSCSFGRYTYGVPLIQKYDNETRLTVGNFCSIANGCKFILGGQHKICGVSCYDWKNFPGYAQYCSFSKGDIVIENDVWFGHSVIILSGVHIGNGAVIGAGSVVAKDVPPYAVVIGNPAKILRFRFDEETIAALQQIQWWNWDDTKLKEKIDLLTADSPEKLIEDCLGAEWRMLVHR